MFHFFFFAISVQVYIILFIHKHSIYLFQAGRANPKVTMHIADLLSTKDLIKVEPPEEYRHM